jgi:hypothetical protein
VGGWDWLRARDARIASARLAMEQVRPPPAEAKVVVSRDRVLRVPLDRGGRLWFIATWLLAYGSLVAGKSDPPPWWVLVLAACALTSFSYFWRSTRALTLMGAILAGATPETIPTLELARELLGKEWLARFGSGAVEALLPVRPLALLSRRLRLAGIAVLLAATVAMTLSVWIAVVIAVLGLALLVVHFRTAKQTASLFIRFREQAVQAVDAGTETTAPGYVGLFGPRLEYLAWCASHGCDPYPFAEPPIPVRAMPAEPPDSS